MSFPSESLKGIVIRVYMIIDTGNQGQNTADISFL